MDLKINKSDWENLDSATRDTITRVITANFKDARIVPDPDGKRLKSAPEPKGNPWCEAACNIAENAAKAVCYGLGDPFAVAACIALAEAAGRECRNRC